ncbi:unnamed protein product [Rotaria sordida]|uniref:Uncharacterized protein n=3 Tax=Rotaria sordida TaxID=392033 RepID=A0A815CRL6_9BILA|nr:unnamed protein product [Rotaria sordida]CAF1287437.1 unnamed protein product [Rotaria sordida]CAF1530404.1 unnamed protein product [Rotaria sordida]CAF1564511.1 unnamed protein product [Rotaria sordida]CAF1564533.1 unnamed protein product [Rotaria sordida]
MPQPTQSDPEFALGVDVSKFNCAFDEHTKFVRQVFRQARYASNPNFVLQNEDMVLSIQNAMKKRDQRLQQDEEYFKHVWQLVKESVKQLKHDHKRNLTFQTLRAQIGNMNPSQSQAADIQSCENSISNN